MLDSGLGYPRLSQRMEKASSLNPKLVRTDEVNSLEKRAVSPHPPPLPEAAAARSLDAIGAMAGAMRRGDARATRRQAERGDGWKRRFGRRTLRNLRNLRTAWSSALLCSLDRGCWLRGS